MASNTDTKIITRIKIKCLPEKINEYGTNNMFQLLDETPLKEFVELKNVKNEYNGKYYLKINAVNLRRVKIENCFKNMFLIVWI